MSKFVRGLLIGLGGLLVLAVLVAIGFQVYGLVSLSRFGALQPMMGGFGRMHPGFGFGYGYGMHMFPWGGWIGLLALGALGVVLVVALIGAARPAQPTRVCAACGKPLEAGWIACPHCGQKV